MPPAVSAARLCYPKLAIAAVARIRTAVETTTGLVFVGTAARYFLSELA